MRRESVDDQLPGLLLVRIDAELAFPVCEYLLDLFLLWIDGQMRDETGFLFIFLLSPRTVLLHKRVVVVKAE